MSIDSLTPPFPAGYSRRACGGPLFFHRGFTLIELLVVILIIGIIISFASLSLGQQSSRSLQDEARRIHSLLRLVSEEAVMQSRELAMQFSPEGYQFMTLDGADSDWVAVKDDKMLREREFPGSIELTLTVEGVETDLRDRDNPPRILLLSSGEMTPFTLTLSIIDGEAYQLQGDFTGTLALTRTGEADDDDW